MLKHALSLPARLTLLDVLAVVLYPPRRKKKVLAKSGSNTQHFGLYTKETKSLNIIKIRKIVASSRSVLTSSLSLLQQRKVILHLHIPLLLMSKFEEAFR
mmetsp:Transcript_8784/g.10055  ORF Transcript_8784/g.10055 Transcript_8784/m.10055 type:complete len:100 (-) Transcript_8784:1935-2234(-)